MSKTSIALGTQLEAPDGFEHLEAGQRYFFLISAAYVKLVAFVEQPAKKTGKKRSKSCKPPPEVMLISIARAKFEYAVENELIVQCDKQLALPSWCEGAELVDTNSPALKRYKKAKIPHSKRTDALVAQMKPLLDRLKDVLSGDDPIKFVNQHAESCTPKQNQSRFRAAFFIFIAFRQNRNAISYQRHNIGRWSRQGHPGAKCGVKAKGLGALHGFKSTDHPDLVKEVQEGWDTFAQAGRSVAAIYRLTCLHIWNCRSIKDSRGRKRLLRPDGQPFLSPDQFRTVLFKTVGAETIYGTLRGRAYVREEKVPSKGRFSESVANACERTEADGYWLAEIPMAPDGVTPLPALIVVRIICVVTSMLLGIGFSLGGEAGSAYRMALFCMAVPKDFFGSLLGMKIDPESWPSEGLSDDTVTDRGPGSTDSGRAADPSLRPVISGMPPTGFGQGKATIESSNPRKIKVRDRPSFVATTVPLAHLVRREVRRTIAQNDSHDISDRLGPRRIAAADRVTPLDLYRKLKAVGRSDERPCSSIEQAVRAYLTPCKLQVKSNGVYLKFQRYDCPELRATGLLHVAANDELDEPLTIPGFVMDLSVRQVWADVNGRLIMVPAMVAIREDDDQFDISVYELDLLAEKLDEMKADLRTHREAVANEAEAAWSEETGYKATDFRRKSGRVHRGTAKAKRESAAVKQHLSQRRKAA
jgi:hypothetical protein